MPRINANTPQHLTDKSLTDKNLTEKTKDQRRSSEESKNVKVWRVDCLDSLHLPGVSSPVKETEHGLPEATRKAFNGNVMILLWA